MNEQTGAERRIVVGVDGSPASVDALRWAVGQARTQGDAVVEALMVWQHPVTTGWAVPIEAYQDIPGITRKILEDSVTEAAGSGDSVEIRTRVQEGGAAAGLLEAARGADLLVVGSRGHGGFTGALLGSVGQHCVQHAPCPVVVVRHRND